MGFNCSAWASRPRLGLGWLREVSSARGRAREAASTMGKSELFRPIGRWRGNTFRLLVGLEAMLRAVRVAVST